MTWTAARRRGRHAAGGEDGRSSSRSDHWKADGSYHIYHACGTPSKCNRLSLAHSRYSSRSFLAFASDLYRLWSGNFIARGKAIFARKNRKKRLDSRTSQAHAIFDVTRDTRPDPYSGKGNPGLDDDGGLLDPRGEALGPAPENRARSFTRSSYEDHDR